MTRLELTIRSNCDRLRIMLAVWHAELMAERRVIDALNTDHPMTLPETRVIK